MQKLPFVWLGSRRARKRNVGEKGRLLDEAAAAGLPVPAGAILLDELYRLLLREKVIVEDLSEETTGVRVSDAHLLYDTLYTGIRFPRLDRKVAVRAAFSAVDVLDGHLKRICNPDLFVNFNDPFQLANALQHVWSSALVWDNAAEGRNSALRRDVLVMEVVDVDVEGIAITRPGTAVDLVKHDKPSASLSTEMPQLRAFRSPDKSLPPFAQRVQRLLRGVRRTFGSKRDVRISWIDDGQICWLIQVQQLS